MWSFNETTKGKPQEKVKKKSRHEKDLIFQDKKENNKRKPNMVKESRIEYCKGMTPGLNSTPKASS